MKSNTNQKGIQMSLSEFALAYPTLFETIPHYEQLIKDEEYIVRFHPSKGLEVGYPDDKWLITDEEVEVQHFSKLFDYKQ